VWGERRSRELNKKGNRWGFVLTVTQRRNWRETGLIANGAIASDWLNIAQAFAGAASGREAPPGITPPAVQRD